MMGTRASWKIGGGVMGLLVLLAILVAANVIFKSIRARVDLTEEKLYSLSAGTRNVLKGLEGEVTLKLFFSASAPETPVQLKNYARQVEDLLKEYRAASGGKIAIEKYDPEPDSEAEEMAQFHGIQGQPVGMFGPPLYFGLVAVYGSTEGSLPALDPRTQELLEYNVTRLIYRLAHAEKPAVGVLSSLPVMGQQEQPQFGMPPNRKQQQAWVAIQQLREDYNVRAVDTDTDAIPEDLKTVILIHPKDLADKTLFALDQFVLRGGRLIVMLDPMSVADMEGQQRQPFMMNMPSGASNLEKLLTAWGVGYDPTKVLADTRAVTVLGGPGNQPQENPVVLSLTADNTSKDDILTTRLETLLMAYAGTFSNQTTKDMTFTPLIVSSKSACLVSASSAQFGPQALRAEMKPSGSTYNLAVRLAGTFKTAFPDGKPAEAGVTNATAAAGEKALKEGKSTIVLVGDVDILFDPICVQQMNVLGTTVNQPRNDNLNFFLNAVEQMSGSEDLIGIRSRGKFFRPFDRVLALEEKARNAWQSKEEELVKRLQDAQTKVNEMQSQKDKNQRYILSKEQKDTIARFREDERQLKKELKTVRKNLRQDIERLGVWVKVLNIGLMPLLVCLAGVGYGMSRRAR